jgi:hypothetical protein
MGALRWALLRLKSIGLKPRVVPSLVSEAMSLI